MQNPLFSQNFNRYSYGLNNPLKFTDPSGETYTWDPFRGTYVDNWGNSVRYGDVHMAMFRMGHFRGRTSIYDADPYDNLWRPAVVGGGSIGGGIRNKQLYQVDFQNPLDKNVA